MEFDMVRKESRGKVPKCSSIGDWKERGNQSATAFNLAVGLLMAIGGGLLIWKARYLSGCHNVKMPAAGFVAIGVVVMVFGLGNTVSCLVRICRQSRLSLAQRIHSGEGSWFGDYLWDANGIYDNGFFDFFETRFVIIFYALLCLLPCGIICCGSGPHSGFIRIFWLTLSATLGGGLIFYNIYSVLRFLKFGRSYLEFVQFPFQPGGKLQAKLVIPKEMPGCKKLSMKIRCIQETLVRERSSDRRTRQSIRPKALFIEDFSCTQIDSTTGRTVASIEFDLPTEDNARGRTGQMLFDEESATDEQISDGGLSTCINQPLPRYWELLVKAKDSFIGYKTVFLLPIYSPPNQAGRSECPQ